MGKQKTYAEEAIASRRWAKGVRIWASILLVLALVFAVLGIVAITQGAGAAGASILVSTAVIAFWGAFAYWFQAPQFDDNARGWDRLDRITR